MSLLKNFPDISQRHMQWRINDHFQNSEHLINRQLHWSLNDHQLVKSVTPASDKVQRHKHTDGQTDRQTCTLTWPDLLQQTSSETDKRLDALQYSAH